jgi:hypothetical protein
VNFLENLTVGSFARIKIVRGGTRAFLASLPPSFFFSIVYFLAYFFRHVCTFQSRVSLARFISRVIIIGLIVTASLFGYLEPSVLLGLKIGYITNILCTILVFIIGVPLSQAKIAHGLSEQVKNHHYNWFINLFRKKVASTLKARIREATIIEMDAIMDEMIGPLLIAIEVLGALLGALMPLIR